MAARTTYSTKIAAHLDREIATAKAQAERELQATAYISENVGYTVVQGLSQAIRRRMRSSPATFLVPLVPLAVVGLGTLLRLLGQPVIASGPAIVALLLLALVLPWCGWQVVRRVRGLPPAPFPLVGLFGRGYSRRRNFRVDDLPLVSELAAPLLGGLTAVPALLVLALAPSAPGLLLAGLVALPILLTALWIVLGATLSALGAVGGVDTSSLPTISAQRASYEELDERLKRLTQMRDWLRDDTLRVMVDEAIGQQVHASERRQVAYSAVVGVVSLAAGWLLSAVSPISVASFFHR